MSRGRWTAEEIELLREHYPSLGPSGCAEHLPSRSLPSITQRAGKLGLSNPRPPAALRPSLGGGDVAKALAMHDAGQSYAAIARAFNCGESSASNAVLKAKCLRAGFTPAKRDSTGALMSRDVKRMRALMMQGLRGVDIQLQLGVSASNVSFHRRKYLAELKLQNKGKTLPRPGAGERYSGAALSKADKLAVEALLLEGNGAKRVTAQTGISNTSVGRIRNRLIARLRRRGECLPGCDLDGTRRRHIEPSLAIPAAVIAALRAHLLEGVPVRRAAKLVGIGGSAAYCHRDALANELAAEGKSLPAPVRLGNGVAGQRAASIADWMPPGKIYRYRMLCREMSPEAARRALLAEVADQRKEEAARPRSFADVLAKVRSGAGLSTKIPLRRADPAMTLGGVATGAL